LFAVTTSFPRVDRGEYERPCGLVSADELDDDRYLGIVDERARVVRETGGRDADAAVGRRVEIGDRHDLDGATGTARDLGVVGTEDLHDAGADGAEADEADF
jgi:hypothetical protein